MALGGSDFKLRCSTSEDPYASFQFTAAADRTSGDLLALNDTVGVVVEDTDSGDDGVLVYQAAKIVVPCAIVTSGSYTVGSKVYYDVGDSEVNEVAAGNTLCGIVVEAPAVGAEEVLIHLMGCLGIVA